MNLSEFLFLDFETNKAGQFFLMGYQLRGETRQPVTSAFGGRRAMIKAFVAGRYGRRLKKVDEK